MAQDDEPDPVVHLQSVLITGGGSGIGAAIATHLASRGCRVLVSGRRRSALEAVAELSDRISICVGDVTDPSHRRTLADTMADLPAARAVVHAAGYFQAGLLNTLSTDDWRRSFETNVEARWALSSQCIHLLAEGRILFIGSDAGSNPRQGAAAYSIAQAGSETLRRAMQAEWATSSTAIGAFKPGLVDTDMVRGFMQLPPEEFPARSAYEEYVSQGRVAAPEAIGRFASWLLLDVETERFAGTEWDVRETDHHPEWLVGRLYPETL